jgi:hypothetical protein
VTALALSADCTAGTTGIPLIDQITQNISKDIDEKLRYHNGMATFVVGSKVGMLVDVNVVGQKFTFVPVK